MSNATNIILEATTAQEAVHLQRELMLPQKDLLRLGVVAPTIIPSLGKLRQDYEFVSSWVIQQDFVTRKKWKGGEEDEEGGHIS